MIRQAWRETHGCFDALDKLVSTPKQNKKEKGPRATRRSFEKYSLEKIIILQIILSNHTFYFHTKLLIFQIFFFITLENLQTILYYVFIRI